MRKAVGDLRPDAVRKALAVGIIGRAHLGRNREAGRDRQANRRHAIKVRTFAAKDILVAANGFITVRDATTETKNILSHPAAIPFSWRNSLPAVVQCSASESSMEGGYFPDLLANSMKRASGSLKDNK